MTKAKPFDNDKQFSDDNMPPFVRFFRRQAKEGQAIYVRGEGAFATWVQRESHVDIVTDSFLNLRKDILGVEVKLRRRRWNDILLETQSCTNKDRESDGWIYTCTADLLCYAFALSLPVRYELYILDMPKLQQWFQGLDLIRYEPVMTKQLNHTKSYPIPWKDIPPELILYHDVIDQDGKEFRRKVNLHPPEDEGVRRVPKSYNPRVPLTDMERSIINSFPGREEVWV